MWYIVVCCCRLATRQLHPLSQVTSRRSDTDCWWRSQCHFNLGLSRCKLLNVLICSGVGTYLSGTARAVPLLKVGRLVMHFAVPLFGHRLHIALMIDVSFIVT